MKNSLTGNALKMFKAVEAAIWSYGLDKLSGELADAPCDELMLGELYHITRMAHGDMSQEDAIELFRKAWAMYEDDNPKPGPIELEKAVGRTIERIEHGHVEGAHGDEPNVTLHFTDGTHHSFVLPQEDELV